MGQAFAQRPQCVHALPSNLGMKWGGAIMPGALNSLTMRMALQQQPQQEHEACPTVDSTFISQFCERVLDECHELVTDRRSHQQWTGQSLGRPVVRSGNVGIVR
ncbi:MAG: hypothetical protein ACYC3X_17830 [Pirellulaceae bacterium]